MNGVVLKVRDGKAVVLTDTGDTIEIAYSGKRGERIELPDRQKKVIPVRFLKQAAAVAASGAIIVTGTLVYSYTTVQASSYVTLDVNPSFEYTLNRRDRVISVDALNEEAEAITEELRAAHIKGKTLMEAVEMTTELLDRDGYLSENGNEILISVTGEDQRSVEKLTEEVDVAFADHKDLSFDVEKATMKDREDAKQNGLSTGAYLKAQEEKTEKQVDTPVPSSGTEQENAYGTSTPDHSSEPQAADSDIPEGEAAPAQSNPDAQDSANTVSPSEPAGNNPALPKDGEQQGGQGLPENTPPQNAVPSEPQGGQGAPDAGQMQPQSPQNPQPQQDPGNLQPPQDAGPQAPGNERNPSGEPGATPSPSDANGEQPQNPPPGGNTGNPPR